MSDSETTEYPAPFRVVWVKRYEGQRCDLFLEALYADPGEETEDATEALMQDIAYDANDPTWTATPNRDGRKEGIIVTFDGDDPPEPGEVWEMVLRPRKGGAIGLIEEI